jgi:hypothetical protein
MAHISSLIISDASSVVDLVAKCSPQRTHAIQIPGDTVQRFVYSLAPARTIAQSNCVKTISNCSWPPSRLGRSFGDSMQHLFNMNVKVALPATQ